MVNLYIEVLAIAIPIIIFIFWFIWKLITDQLNKRRYKPENDKAKQGENKRHREDDGRGKRRIVKRRPDKSGSERGILSTTKSGVSRENGSGLRKNRKSSRRIRVRRRR